MVGAEGTLSVCVVLKADMVEEYVDVTGMPVARRLVGMFPGFWRVAVIFKIVVSVVLRNGVISVFWLLGDKGVILVWVGDFIEAVYVEVVFVLVAVFPTYDMM
jgi:hypothetical protein